MKTHHYIRLILLLTAGLVSCSKERSFSDIRFRVHSSIDDGDPATRISFSGNTAKNGATVTERLDWSKNDLLCIYSPQAYLPGKSSVHAFDYVISQVREDGTQSTAQIKPYKNTNALKWNNSDRQVFYAMYPSPSTEGLKDVSFENGTMVFSIPAVQTVTRKEGTATWLPDMKYAPMLAASETEAGADVVDLDFTPHYTAFSFSLGKDGYDSVHLKEFTLTAATGYLTGTFTVCAGDYRNVDSVKDGGQTITVDLSGIVLDASMPVFTFTVLAIPQAVSGLKISFTADEFGTRSLSLSKNGQELQFAPFKKYNITGLGCPDVFSRGFSVAENKTVAFSPGNLQYIGSASTPYWKFADHQYDIVGRSTSSSVKGQNSNATNVDRDLFGWGTGSNPNLVSTSTSDYKTFTDWGTNYIVNGKKTDAPNTWRTPTKDEWVYLIETREVSNTLKAGARYTMATLGGQYKGLILFPDTYTHPSGTGFSGWAYNEPSNYSSSVSLEGWAKMELAGAIFLPAAGYRNGTNVSNDNSFGHYESSTNHNENTTYLLRFLYESSEKAVDPAKYYRRDTGRSVRLVRDL